jgi:hypothetical protein
MFDFKINEKKETAIAISSFSSSYLMERLNYFTPLDKTKKKVFF